MLVFLYSKDDFPNLSKSEKKKFMFGEIFSSSHKRKIMILNRECGWRRHVMVVLYVIPHILSCIRLINYKCLNFTGYDEYSIIYLKPDIMVFCFIKLIFNANETMRLVFYIFVSRENQPDRHHPSSKTNYLYQSWMFR